MTQIVMYQDTAGDYRWVKFDESLRLVGASERVFGSKQEVEADAKEQGDVIPTKKLGKRQQAVLEKAGMDLPPPEADAEIRWAKEPELHFLSTENPSDAEPHG